MSSKPTFCQAFPFQVCTVKENLSRSLYRFIPGSRRKIACEIENLRIMEHFEVKEVYSFKVYLMYVMG